MERLNKLRGLIKEKFGSETIFANKIEVDRSYLSNILNGKREISIVIAKKMATSLELDADTIKYIFFD